MTAIIPLDVFNMDVAVFATEEDRIECLIDQGCEGVEAHDPAALSSAHLDVTAEGKPRLSMVIKPEATQATWAHECVHIADFAMNCLGIPMGHENTEIRAYLVGHLFSHLSDIMEDRLK